MRMWVPHRHRLGLMCLRTSFSEGEELRRSSASARMIMPGMQKPHCAACGNEGPLQRTRIVNCAKTFECRDAPTLGYNSWSDAGEHRLVIQQDCAGTALAETAAELCAIEPEVVAQDVEKRGRAVCVDLMVAAIDVEREHTTSVPPYSFGECLILRTCTSRLSQAGLSLNVPRT